MPDFGSEVVPQKADVEISLTGEHLAILSALNDIEALEGRYHGLVVRAVIRVEERHITTEFIGRGHETLKMNIEDLLNIKLEGVPFTQGVKTRTAECLRRAGINTVGELVQRDASELRAITGFGAACLELVEASLAKLDLELKPERRP